MKDIIPRPSNRAPSLDPTGTSAPPAPSENPNYGYRIMTRTGNFYAVARVQTSHFGTGQPIRPDPTAYNVKHKLQIASARLNQCLN